MTRVVVTYILTCHLLLIQRLRLQQEKRKKLHTAVTSYRLPVNTDFRVLFDITLGIAVQLAEFFVFVPYILLLIICILLPTNALIYIIIIIIIIIFLYVWCAPDQRTKHTKTRLLIYICSQYHNFIWRSG